MTFYRGHNEASPLGAASCAKAVTFVGSFKVLVSYRSVLGIVSSCVDGVGYVPGYVPVVVLVHVPSLSLSLSLASSERAAR